ncbi:MAG: protein kinase domain-containing protein, partial [Anaerolineales bacterium]
MVLERGALVNQRYRIIEILGQGGMGAVYRAIDENLGVEVALKENLFTTEEYARQFHREAVILANLRHPNLTRVTDHFIIEGQGQYLVMDYVEGEDLRDRMERLGVISEEEAVQIGAAICDALTYLDTRTEPIVHRDIKPGNVKISPNGHIYLVDFGLAKIIEGNEVTTTGARAMTPGYSPPEQYGTARTDHRSDIYSLGATLYAAVTGHLPEDGLARLMGQAELTKVRARNPKISPAFAAVIEKALEVKPEDRYANAREFKEALLESQRNRDKVTQQETNQHLSATRLKTSPAEYVRTLQHFLPIFFQKRWFYLPVWVWTILALFMIGLAIWLPSRGIAPAMSVSPSAGTTMPFAMVVTPSQTMKPTTFQPTSQASLVNTSTPTFLPSLTPFGGIVSEETPTPTISPTPFGGSRGQIAFASNRSGTNQVWLMNLDGSGLTQVTDIPEGACQPNFSSDGMRLIFISPCPDDSES